VIVSSGFAGPVEHHCAIALGATYLLWPKDRETPESVPAAAT
jgi:hypothetical protein